ncbi:hypothetical protein [Streptomyces sp. NPDC054794]
MTSAYALDDQTAKLPGLLRIADRWKPYRSWIALLLRAHADPHTSEVRTLSDHGTTKGGAHPIEATVMALCKTRRADRYDDVGRRDHPGDCHGPPPLRQKPATAAPSRGTAGALRRHGRVALVDCQV